MQWQAYYGSSATTQVPLHSFLTIRWGVKEHTERKDSLGGLQQKPRMKLSEIVADILSLLPKFGQVYVCLDGLDECYDLQELVKTLERLTSSSYRLFVSSRSLPELERLLEDAYQIRMEECNLTDIKLYLDNYRQQHPELDEIMNEDLASVVSKTITDRSHGK